MTRGPLTQGPLIVVFSQPGCPACEEFAPIFARAAKDQTVKHRVIDINSPEGDKLSDAYGVDSTPTIVVFFSVALPPIKYVGVIEEAGVRKLFAMAR